MKTPPESYAAYREIECTESIGAPVADTIFAVVAGVLSLSLFISSSNPDPDAWLDFSDIERGVAGIMLIPMLVHSTSAIYGYASATKCKRAKTGYKVVRIPSTLGIAAQDADGQPQGHAEQDRSQDRHAKEYHVREGRSFEQQHERRYGQR